MSRRWQVGSEKTDRSEGPHDLLARLEEALRDSTPLEGPFNDDATFNRWALEIHEAQAAADPRLAAYWASRGAERVDHWTDVPPVPASAFKATPFGPRASAEAVFRTSGTSGAGASPGMVTGELDGGPRGEHRVARLALYRASTQANYRRHLLPSRPRGLPAPRLLSLIPTVVDAPDSSLARMASFIAEEPDVRSTVWAFRLDRGVDVELCRIALGGEGSLLIVTTAFALVQLLDAVYEDRWVLPSGSGVMETGGFKGRSAELSRSDLYRRVEAQLGVPCSHVIGEYGMTELLSQSYDGVLGSAPPVQDRVHRFPPWVRTRVLDPRTLMPQPVGQAGLLAHYDLANAGSVCHILTEDMGVENQRGGFTLLGRATDAEARGCSMIAEEFVARVRTWR